MLMEARSTAPGTEVCNDTLLATLLHTLRHMFSSSGHARCESVPTMQLAVCDSPAGRLGLTVCYDLRFPEMYQRLTFERGAEVLLVPSAFTKATGEGRVPRPKCTSREMHA